VPLASKRIRGKSPVTMAGLSAFGRTHGCQVDKMLDSHADRVAPEETEYWNSFKHRLFFASKTAIFFHQT